MSLRRNSVWNLVGSGAPFLLGLVTIPYLIRQLGVEAFGILTLVWGLIGYFSLFDFGLGRALTQQVARSLATGKQEQVSSIVKYGLLLTALTGLAGGLVLALLAVPLATKWLNINSHLQAITVSSLLTASLGIPLTTVTVGLRGVLEAHEDFSKVNLLKIILGAGNFGLPALGIMVFGPSLLMAVASLILVRIVVLIGHVILVYLKMHRTWLVARYDRAYIANLLSFGAWMTLSNVISPLMVSVDRFIISGILGASVVAYYTVPFDSLFRLLVIPSAITVALFPRFAAVRASAPDEAGRLLKRCKGVVSMIMLPICLLVIAGAYLGLKFWLGADFARHSWPVASLLGIGLFFNSVAQIPHAAIEARGDARTTALIHLGESLFYLPLLFLFIRYFGLPGAALAWTLRVGADYFLLAYFAIDRLPCPPGGIQHGA